MRNLVLFLLIFSLAHGVQAQEANTSNDSSEKEIRKLFESLEYPELEVVPRATKRLKMAASDERKNWWYVHWQIQLSSLSTLFLGFTSSGRERTSLSAEQKDDASTASTAAKLVGGGWIVGTVLLGLNKPYAKGVREFRASKDKSKRGELLRERLAEETLERQARLMKRLSHVSVFTNLGASIYLGTFLDETGAVYTGISAILAFLPYFFEDDHIFNYKKHLEYKRSIYTPIASMQLREVSREDETRLLPTLNLAWSF